MTRNATPCSGGCQPDKCHRADGKSVANSQHPAAIGTRNAHSTRVARIQPAGQVGGQDSVAPFKEAVLKEGVVAEHRKAPLTGSAGHRHGKGLHGVPGAEVAVMVDFRDPIEPTEAAAL